MKQAALRLQAKEGDAEYENEAAAAAEWRVREEPSEEVLKMREVVEKVFMAALTDPTTMSPRAHGPVLAPHDTYGSYSICVSCRRRSCAAAHHQA